jgi:hypothetical protein
MCSAVQPQLFLGIIQLALKASASNNPVAQTSATKGLGKTIYNIPTAESVRAQALHTQIYK